MENQNQNQERKPQKSKAVFITIIFVVGVALILSFIANAILWNTGNQKNELAISKIDSLMYFYSLRDSLTRQINEEELKVENMQSMLSNSNDSFANLLQEKKSEISSLRRMVRSEGNNSNILALKESISRLTSMNAALRKRIEDLQKENTDYKTKVTAQQNQINDLNSQKNILQNKVESASEPRIGGLTVVPNADKKGVSFPVYKAKEVDYLDVSFEVYENKLSTKKVDKEYIIRILDPDGIVLSNDNNQLTNSTEVYTAKESVRVNGKAQKIQIKHEQTAKYKKGKYSVELKDNNKIIQTTDFNLI
jgi:flagellar basal body-associated protein FliL